MREETTPKDQAAKKMAPGFWSSLPLILLLAGVPGGFSHPWLCKIDPYITQFSMKVGMAEWDSSAPRSRGRGFDPRLGHDNL